MNNQETTIREQLLAGRTVATFTHGSSMEPLLYENETHVVIQSIYQSDGSIRNLKKGELPIYQCQNGTYVIHRLIRIDSEYYYTRGDNNVNSEKIPKNWVLGVVIEIYRNGRIVKVNDWKYQLYVHIWSAIFPARCLWYHFHRRGKRFYESK